MHDPSHRRARLLAGAFLVFGLVALLEATQGWIGWRLGYVNARAFGGPGSHYDWSDVFLRQLASWWIIVLLAVPVAAFSLRVPITNGRLRAGRLLAHVGLSLLFAFSVSWFTTLYRYHVFIPTFPGGFRQMLLNRLSLYSAINLLYYWAIVGTCSAVVYYRLYRERALNEARLDRALSDAQLRSLQARMQPHFLFNTLNAVCGYALERNHDVVITMLARLSDLLRASFRNRPDHAITLAEELELLQAYVELQQMRLGPRLHMKMSVDPAALDAVVPPLVLQPIVENAIQHGIGSTREGTVEVDVRCSGGMVEVQVSDDGPGFSNGDGGDGFGLAATAERLQLMYGAHARLNTAERAGGGALVRLRIPNRRTVARNGATHD